MQLRWISPTAALLALCVPLLHSCGGGAGKSETNPAADPSSELAACRTTADCPAEHLCLTDGRSGGCAPICTGSSDACGAEASCGGVGIFEVQACQPQKSPEEVDEPDEQPRVPCATDAECRILDGRAVCAEYQGVRDCTLPCTIESDCDPPSLGGMSLDFLRCAADEGAPARSACLPDPRCFTDPFACVSSGQCSGPGAFLCATGECIDASDVCDGLADCGSGDDEVACTQPACGVGEVPCASGECIAAAFVCDLFEDCADGSDESSCN